MGLIGIEGRHKRCPGQSRPFDWSAADPALGFGRGHLLNMGLLCTDSCRVQARDSHRYRRRRHRQNVNARGEPGYVGSERQRWAIALMTQRSR